MYGTAYIKIYDINGKMIISKQMNISGSGIYEMNIKLMDNNQNNLVDGYYTVSVEFNGEKINGKILLNK